MLYYGVTSSVCDSEEHIVIFLRGENIRGISQSGGIFHGSVGLDSLKCQRHKNYSDTEELSSSKGEKDTWE